MVKKGIALIIVIGIMFACGLALAKDIEQKKENRTVGFFKKIFLWPINIFTRGGEGVLNTVEKGVEGAAKTGKAFSGVVTGDIQQADDLFIEPVKGTAQTTVTAVEETIKTPIEGTEKTWDEK